MSWLARLRRWFLLADLREAVERNRAAIRRLGRCGGAGAGSFAARRRA